MRCSRLPYVQVVLIVAAISAIAVINSRERGFRERLFDESNNRAVSEGRDTRISSSGRLPDENDSVDIDYHAGDWEHAIVNPRYRAFPLNDNDARLYYSDDFLINASGSIECEFLYGKSIFTRKRYRRYNRDKPVSAVIKEGLRAKQAMSLHIEGTVGDRLTVLVDHDQRKKDNRYRFRYRAIGEDEFIRELTAGEIDIHFRGSKYAVYEQEASKGIGVAVAMRKKGFEGMAFASMRRGVSGCDQFRGNTVPGTITIPECRFARGVYYQIEPIIRYRGCLAPPYPPDYRLEAVNLNPIGFEIYIDDQDPTNNADAIHFSLDGGWYTRMQSGVDYKVNFAAGLVQFLKPLPEKSRVFAAYTLICASTDPHAIRPGDPRHPGGMFAGRILAFIKYGYSLSDCPVTSSDIYEVRSFYHLGEQNLQSHGFHLAFRTERGDMTRSDIMSLGRYRIDYHEGVIEFMYREPFRELLGSAAPLIYAERQPVNVLDYSKFRIQADYLKEARGFKLSHANLVPESVSVKVDGHIVSPSLYTVDYVSGYVSFRNSGNPSIGPRTLIEVRYEYLPVAGGKDEFVGGFRGEYQFSRDLKIGGSLLYARSGGGEVIPEAGAEPTRTVCVEGDVAFNLDGRRLADLVNLVTRDRVGELPFRIRGYAEYARSYKNINTFGKALIDNMEGIEEATPVSLDEREWIPASRPPAGLVRKKLNYYYYRDAQNPFLLKGLNHIAPLIPYEVKSGPFNVAVGHVLSPAVSMRPQVSLVLDFDPAGDFAAIAARIGDRGAVDLSGIQYLEISYLYTGSADASCVVEVGRLNEDADEDGILDTEDLNGNGIIDADPATGVSEDIGYVFNESGHARTRVGGGPAFNHLLRGDGVLSTEDLNGNGVLDTGERMFRFGPPIVLEHANQRWQVARLYLDRTSLTHSDQEILRAAESIRIAVTNAEGVGGRLYIDSIRFVSIKWREESVDGAAAKPDQIRAACINSLDDDEYRLESFAVTRRDRYASMYGVKSNADLLKERESSLKVEYRLPARVRAAMTRRLSQPVDLRRYRTLVAWLNVRNARPGDSLGLIIGSSDRDYLEFRVPLSFQRTWIEMKMRLRGGSDGCLVPAAVSGVPDMKRITYAALAVYPGDSGGEGAFWLDEIYVEDPEIVRDDAHWIEGEIQSIRPFYITKSGIPLFSKATLTYVHKGRGAGFSSIGKPDDDMSQRQHLVSASVDVIPSWRVRIEYTREDSKTESRNERVEEPLRGVTRRDRVAFVSDFTPEASCVPKVSFAYRFEGYRNTRSERVELYEIKRRKIQDIHDSTIQIRHEMDTLFGGRLSNEFRLAMEFNDERVRRSSIQIAPEDFSSAASPLEVHKSQAADLTYSLSYANRCFFFRPECQVASREIVALFGRSDANLTEVRYPVRGRFHVPFVYRSDMRFVDRRKKLSGVIGMTDWTFIAPMYRVDLQYLENNFRDYDLEKIPFTGFRRSRDARAVLSSAIDIPLYLHKTARMTFLKSLEFSYRRLISLAETGVPYEGERKPALDERYGISRSVGRLAKAAYNLFRYYPFYFYTGRGTCGHGRDYLMNTMNAPLFFADGTVIADYNASLQAQEDASAGCSMDFNPITVTSSGGVHQVINRRNVYGIPSQTITAFAEIASHLDLVKACPFECFKQKKEGDPVYSAFMKAGYRFERLMHITQNIEETIHAPLIGLDFRRDRIGVTSEFSVGIKERRTRRYLSRESLRRSGRDYWYILNMPQHLFFKEKEIGYSFSIKVETEVEWIYRFFEIWYRLSAHPLFTLSYSMKINRYDYITKTEPEGCDEHLLAGSLSLDLHANVRGGLKGRIALERQRNRYTGRIQREMISFEGGGSITIIF